MRTFKDAKAFLHAKEMAQSLRTALQSRSIALTHSDSLELIAQAFGLDNWNILAAKIAASEAGDVAKIRFSPPIPIIRMFDIEKAKDFYLRKLGFKWEWEHRFGPEFPLYAQIAREGLKLHLSEHGGDGSPGSITFIDMVGLKEFHKELVGRGITAGIEDGPGNRSTLQVWDPFSNRLRFSEQKPGDSDRGTKGYSSPNE